MINTAEIVSINKSTKTFKSYLALELMMLNDTESECFYNTDYDKHYNRLTS